MTNGTSVHIANPRDIVIGSSNYLATVEEYSSNFVLLNSINLTTITRKPYGNPPQMAVTFFNNAYYIASINGIITVIDSENLTILANIFTYVTGIRGLIFLNDGQTMVVTSYEENSVVFLNRTSVAPINYRVFIRRTPTFNGPHGIWRVNDSFFYVTSYTNNSLYSFSAMNTYLPLNESFVLRMTVTNGAIGSSRVTVDECNRFWFTFETDTILIYDQYGTKLGNWTIPNSSIFDIKITNSYLIYLSESNQNRTRRFQPNIQC